MPTYTREIIHSHDTEWDMMKAEKLHGFCLVVACGLYGNLLVQKHIFIWIRWIKGSVHIR